MHHVPVVSSNIASVGYDAGEKLMEIKFHNGGLYQYKHIASSTWTNFINAQSKGKYFATNIKPYYEGELVNKTVQFLELPEPVKQVAPEPTARERSSVVRLLHLLQDEVAPYKTVLQELYNDLPRKRDWLDPVLEERIKELIK